MEIPKIDRDFFCITNIDEPILSAIVSSYIFKENFYCSMYEFSNVTDFENEISGNEIDENQKSRIRAREFNIRIRNTLQRMRGCENLILIGLSEQQKSYLTFSSSNNTIDIENIEDIDTYLSPFFPNKEDLVVREDDILKALSHACKNNLILKINNGIGEFKIEEEKEESSDILIITENHQRASTVISINYANSIKANIEIIDKPKINLSEIEELIGQWKNGNDQAYEELNTYIYPLINHLDISKYEYLTAFTICIPYSLILNNIIPITHVNINLHPDFLIFNSLYFENTENFNSALIFSPKEFKDEEEIDLITDELKKHSLFIQELIGEIATASNLDYFLKLFPFDLFHICSHGGEIDGYKVEEQFTDSSGVEHIIEYDEVVTFSPETGEDLVKVTSKCIWRKFNGYKWKSKELKEQNYPQYVFTDMHKSVFQKIDKKRTAKKNILGSASIKCYDFNYQGLFNMIAAGNKSPIIFNNTCQSWSRISDSFIAAGSRLYIGTLWNIDNNIAKNVSEDFYKKLINDSLLNSLYQSQKISIGTNDENIYLLWGLHFCKFKTADSLENTRNHVLEKLLISLETWKEDYKKDLDVKIKQNISRNISWIAEYLTNNFQVDIIQRLKTST